MPSHCEVFGPNLSRGTLKFFTCQVSLSVLYHPLQSYSGTRIDSKTGCSTVHLLGNIEIDLLDHIKMVAVTINKI